MTQIHRVGLVWKDGPIPRLSDEARALLPPGVLPGIAIIHSFRGSDGGKCEVPRICNTWFIPKDAPPWAETVIRDMTSAELN